MFTWRWWWFETENPWKLAMLVGSGVARWWWTPIRGGVRVLLAENTRNTSGNRAPLLWEKGNHNCESLAVMSAIILIKNNSLPPHGSGPNWRISVFSPRHLMQLACRVSRFRRQSDYVARLTCSKEEILEIRFFSDRSIDRWKIVKFLNVAKVKRLHLWM